MKLVPVSNARHQNTEVAQHEDRCRLAQPALCDLIRSGQENQLSAATSRHVSRSSLGQDFTVSLKTEHLMSASVPQATLAYLGSVTGKRIQHIIR